MSQCTKASQPSLTFLTAFQHIYTPILTGPGQALQPPQEDTTHPATLPPPPCDGATHIAWPVCAAHLPTGGGNFSIL